MLITLVILFAKPETSLSKLTVIALLTSFGVELSQLYQAPWLNHIRSTLPGHLVLGSGFDPYDLLAYFVGTALTIAMLRARDLHTLNRETYVRDEKKNPSTDHRGHH